MKILSYTILSSFFLLFLVGCNEKKTEKKYFDIPGYFEQQIQYVNTKYTTVSKVAVYNGDTSISESKVANVNWKKEWAIFLEADINKPIYYANMTESDFGEYFAQSKKLSIQQVKLEYAKTPEGVPGNDVIGIELSVVKGNLISSTSIEAKYQKNWGYTITGLQDIHYLNHQHSYFVEGQFH